MSNKGLRLNLDKERILDVTGADPVFEDTPFQGKDFTVRVKPITAAALSAETRKFVRTNRKGRQVIEDAKLGRELFLSHVVGWSGICDEDGEPLVCNDKTKEAVYENYMMLGQGVLTVALENRLVQPVDEEELKNSEQPGSGD